MSANLTHDLNAAWSGKRNTREWAEGMQAGGYSLLRQAESLPLAGMCKHGRSTWCFMCGPSLSQQVRR